ncbi:MAG TPA: hypothetical protein VKQ36_10060 [Ktedonobacterales bacterium]|nr:hypothetical protein [Ktedonobacterales bacterium]
MVPSAMLGFFTASVGASAALIGLLFVAISISPEKIIASGATLERRMTASSAFSALLNVFFISLVAIIPLTNLGYVVVILGALSTSGTISQVIQGFPRAQSGRPRPTVQEGFRLLTMPLASIVVYGYELYWGYLLFTGQVKSVADFSTVAYILIGVYGLGITRAWELIFDERHGLILTLMGMFFGHLIQSRVPTQQAEKQTPSGAAEESTTSASPASKE